MGKYYFNASNYITWPWLESDLNDSNAEVQDIDDDTVDLETVITVKQGNKKLELTIPSDTDIWDWEDSIRTILTWITFQPKTIDKLFSQCDCDHE